MYKLSISSLLVVLVTLQQHHTAAAMSLSEQFEQLILNLEEEEQTPVEELEVCITYNQIQDVIRSFSQCESNTCPASLHNLVLELIQSNQQWTAEKNLLDFFLAENFVASEYFHVEAFNLFPETSAFAPVIDARERIQALNCILLI